jgi:hypothetical protein
MAEQNSVTPDRLDESSPPSPAAFADVVRDMERIVSQQRRMSYFLMLLQEESGRDERLRSLEVEFKQLETLVADLSRRISLLEHAELFPSPPKPE